MGRHYFGYKQMIEYCIYDFIMDVIRPISLECKGKTVEEAKNIVEKAFNKAGFIFKELEKSEIATLITFISPSGYDAGIFSYDNNKEEYFTFYHNGLCKEKIYYDDRK